MRELWPPLTEIAEHVRFGSALQIAEPPELAPPLDIEAPPALSALVLDEIRRSAAARQPDLQTVTPGSLVLIDGRRDRLGRPVQKLAHPVCFCVDRPATPIPGKDGQLWLGWIAAPELDYASNFDMLLEPGDEPFDPQAGMIQTWNPATLWIPFRTRRIGTLSPERLAAARALAADFAGDRPDPARPRAGHVSLRSVGDGRSALTGTPLDRPDRDPRHAYQALYRKLGRHLDCDQAANVERLGPVATLHRWIAGHPRPSLAIAASAMVAAIALGTLRIGAPGDADQLAAVSLPPPVQTPPNAPPAKVPQDAPTTAGIADPATPLPRPAKPPVRPDGAAPSPPTTPASASGATSNGRVTEPGESSPPQSPASPIQLAYLEPLADDLLQAGDAVVVRSKQELNTPARYRLQLVNGQSAIEARRLLFDLDVMVIDEDAAGNALIVEVENRQRVSELEQRLAASRLFARRPATNSRPDAGRRPQR